VKSHAIGFWCCQRRYPQSLPALLVALLLGLHIAMMAPGRAYAQAPVINALAPLGLQPGQTAKVVVRGSNLGDARHLWTSIAAEAALDPESKNDASSATFVVRVPQDAAPGVAAVRVATTRGISNLVLLLVDDLPGVAKRGGNGSASAAQEVPFPAAVDGACDAETFDYYRFAGKRGQRVSIEVWARRLGSPLDPVIRLLDASGKELAYSDDEPGLGADCRIDCQLPGDGDYLIELRDIRYAGGAGHRYRLRLGSFPRVNVPVPSAVAPGTSVQVALAGPDAELAGTLDVAVPPDARERLPLAVRLPDGQGSTLLNLLVVDPQRPEVVEHETGDHHDAAQELSLPVAVTGRFHHPRDRDYYRFAAAKGERITFRGLTRSLGSPADLLLRVLNEQGTPLVEVDDTGTDEGILDWTAPADGTYYLVAEDLLRRGGAEMVYRIEAERNAGRYGLTLAADKFDVPQGGALSVKVTAQRAGYDGPITLELDGAPGDLQLEGRVIDEKKPETTLKVAFPASYEPGTVVTFRVRGRAKVGDTEVLVTADALPAVRQALSGLAYPPPDVASVVAVGIGPQAEKK
jgi:hypothetical protein